MRRKVALVPGLSGSGPSFGLAETIRREGGEVVVTRTIPEIRKAAAEGMVVVPYSSGCALADVALQGTDATQVQIAPFGGRGGNGEVVTGSSDWISPTQDGDTVAHGYNHFAVTRSAEAGDAIRRAIKKQYG